MPVLRYHTGGGVYADLPGSAEEVTISPNQPPVNTDLWIDTDDDTGYIPSSRLGSRNVIRNGDMSIAQRGGGPFATSGPVTLDGYQLYFTPGTTTITRVAQAVGEGSNFLQAVVTGQAGASAQSGVWAIVEGVATLSGKTATISFDAKAATGTPKVGIVMQQDFGSGGSVTTEVCVGTVTLGTTKTRHSLTFTVPSIAGKTIGAGGGLLWVGLLFSGGSSTAYSPVGIQNNTFSFTDIQLEEGSVATPFERLPVAQQLAWCQRYFQRIGSDNPNVLGESAWIYFGLMSLNGGGSWHRYYLRHAGTMRSTPTIVSTAPNSFVVSAEGSEVPATGLQWWTSTAANSEAQVLTSGGLPGYSNGACVSLYQNASIPCYIDLSAEL